MRKQYTEMINDITELSDISAEPERKKNKLIFLSSVTQEVLVN